MGGPDRSDEKTTMWPDAVDERLANRVEIDRGVEGQSRRLPAREVDVPQVHRTACRSGLLEEDAAFVSVRHSVL